MGVMPACRIDVVIAATPARLLSPTSSSSHESHRVPLIGSVLKLDTRALHWHCGTLRQAKQPPADMCWAMNEGRAEMH
jgi:hypothetical protein